MENFRIASIMDWLFHFTITSAFCFTMEDVRSAPHGCTATIGLDRVVNS